jgi:hypothetical protein
VVDVVGGDEARSHVDELSHRYVGGDYPNPIGPSGRIILKIAPDKVNTPRKLGRQALPGGDAVAAAGRVVARQAVELRQQPG